jgi:hypothetical protein
LDDDIEEIGLRSMQPMLDNEQVARRGNGNELGQSLDDAENDNEEPVRQDVWCQN